MTGVPRLISLQGLQYLLDSATKGWHCTTFKSTTRARYRPLLLHTALAFCTRPPSTLREQAPPGGMFAGILHTEKVLAPTVYMLSTYQSSSIRLYKYCLQAI